ncbi:hypothetical protein J3E64_002709 [Sphingobium sp. OAS761]|uniref:hypothetical protein n=1 Tax=Sphingobium sp. OAS761 TaxID=2817901 RepID=UPI0020A0CFFD|nr:hypothetical protein [Sphingobium sp. OAS761]MCP1471012.1 hypothetical protein [Sphingobium sp. OAS761]
MRRTAIAVAIMVFALGACDARQPPAGGAGGTAQDERLADCAIGADAPWAHDCALERDGRMLIIRHPDGGFRRFRVLDNGRGLEAIDGAEVAQLQIVDQGKIEVRIGGDRYRLPAVIAGEVH